MSALLLVSDAALTSVMGRVHEYGDRRMPLPGVIGIIAAALAAIADEDGRGLTLVEALADRWGSLPVNGSKIVWFALATDGSAGRERYLRACLLPVRRCRSYLLGEYARCLQRRE